MFDPVPKHQAETHGGGERAEIRDSFDSHIHTAEVSSSICVCLSF